MKGAFLASANCGNRAKNGEKSRFTANKLSTYAQSFATAPGLRAPEIGIFTELSSKFNLLSTADPRDLAVYRREISMSTRKMVQQYIILCAHSRNRSKTLENAGKLCVMCT